MSKQHPIRKMADRVEKCDTLLGVERSLARSVKPLLDALTNYHEFFCGCDLKDIPKEKGKGEFCAMLAAWKEPIK